MIDSQNPKLNIKKIIHSELCAQKMSAQEIAARLDEGAVIGYPTETVYGLGGDARNEAVMQRICQLKDRDADKPFLLLIRDREALSNIVQDIPDKAEKLISHFWPGSLTLLFSISKPLPIPFKENHYRLGIRVSPDPICKQILEHFDQPLISTSANPGGKRPARTAAEALNYFNDALDFVIDDGERQGRKASTVLDITVDPPKMIREGEISLEEIQSIIGEIDG